MKPGVIAAAFLLSVLMLAGSAVRAHEPGPGWGWGRGPCGQAAGPGLSPGGQYDEKSAELERGLYQKQAELTALLAAPRVDEEKARAVHEEIKALAAGLADRRFEQALEYKRKNPDWQPGFGGRCFFGPGFRQGRGSGPLY